MKKLIRITTVDFAQSDYMKGQNRYMSQYFEVIGAASDTGVLEDVARNEGVRMVNIPMKREMSPFTIFIVYVNFISYLRKKNHILSILIPLNPLCCQ